MNTADKIQVALVAATAASVILAAADFIWKQTQKDIKNRLKMLIDARQLFEKNLVDYKAGREIDRLTDIYEIIILLERYYNLPFIGNKMRQKLRQILRLLEKVRQIQSTKKWVDLDLEDKKVIFKIFDLFGYNYFKKHHLERIKA